MDARPGHASGRTRTTASVLSSDLIIGDDQLERSSLLRENAPDRLGEMGRPVAGRDRDGQE